MWWNVLIIPSGYRYKVALGEDSNFEKLSQEYRSIENRAKIKYTLDKGINPDKNDNWRMRGEVEQYHSINRDNFSTP